MAAIVTFHAHPDDEVIATGGTIARAADDGHRVVLVVATGGERREVPDDLAAGETLADRRRDETEAAAAEIGIDRIVWLGYRDSGMTGWEGNGDPGSFHQADVEVASRRLAAVIAEESADVLTIYDWHGTYGHPDHVQVHRVGTAAAALVPGVRVLEATMNRDALAAMVRDARRQGVTIDGPNEEADEDFDPHQPADDGNPMGTPEAELTLGVDVVPWIVRKRAALRCHRSQVAETSFFSTMPDDAFAQAFGTEWFVEPGVDPPVRYGWIFDG
jgi:LmbE family N-acetylglucosaminyl deacetylase